MRSRSTKRWGLTALLGVATAAPLQAANAPPPYQKLRYDEDYSYLKDPSQRSDFWDPVKYIPLNEAGDWYLSLGGEARWRYERYRNYQWNPDAKDDDGYALQRYLLSGDLHLGERFRVFGQLQSSLESGRQGGPRPTDEDRLDLHQLFADVRFPLGGSGEDVTLRVGRQEILYGSQRIVSVRESPNIRRAFDGVRLLARVGSWRVDALATRTVEDDPGVFDDWESTHTYLWGLYATHRLGDAASLDLYYLGVRKPDSEFVQGTADQRRHSLGARLFGEAGAFDYDVEGLFQLGRFGTDGIVAWTIASDGGYTFEDATFSPRLGLRTDVISGDTDADDGTLGTFDPLFPRGAYFSEASLVWPANLIDVDGGVELHLTKRVVLAADWDIFWRYSTADGLYTSGGNLARPAVGDARFVGHQPSVTLTWQAGRHTTLELAYAHFFAGAFIRESGSDTDVDFAAVWWIYRF